ncbi:MAG: hypothetical protein IPK77_12850 [Cellvibrio sp.]|nr:hypothetical protein [Cellvibrio sp.]
MNDIDLYKNKGLLRLSFGWNFKVWSKPFLEAQQYINNIPKDVLEIGAGKFSAASLVFHGLSERITIGYYTDDQKHAVENIVNEVCAKYPSNTVYIVEKIDAFTINKKYDLVIMKSVLGGLFRLEKSSINDCNIFMQNLASRTLRNEGTIITIDNGKSLFEKLILKFGARKNGWRFFIKNELPCAQHQFYFGLLSAFTCETRLGFSGQLIDNYIVAR